MPASGEAERGRGLSVANDGCCCKAELQEWFSEWACC
jgi:hypothetical protein